MTKIAVVFILLGVGIILTNFSPGDRKTKAAAVTSKIKARWPIAMPTKIMSLDPQQAVSAYEKTIITLLFSRIVSLDESVQVAGELAETWDFDMVSYTYSFRLRKDVFFSDGRQLMARDVIFSIHQWAAAQSLDSDLLKDISGVGPYQSGTASSIAGISAPNDFTVNIQLSRWSESFVQVLAMNRFVIFPENFNGMTRSNFFKHPVGSGPYVLESYSPKVVKYRANLSFFRGRPATGQIDVLFLEEANAREEFKQHRLYDLLLYDFTSMAGLDDENLVIQKSDSFSTVALYFVETDSRVSLKKTREDLASKLDIDTMIKKCFPDSSRAMTLIPPGFLGSEGVSIKNGPPSSSGKIQEDRITILIPSDLSNSCFVQNMRAQLINTNFEIEVVDWDKMYKLFKSGKMSIGIENLIFKTQDPICVLQYFRATSNEYLIGKKIPKLEHLFLKLNENLTMLDKGRIYRSIDALLTEEYHVIPLLHASRYTVYRSSLKNVKFAGSHLNMINWHEIMIEE